MPITNYAKQTRAVSFRFGMRLLLAGAFSLAGALCDAASATTGLLSEQELFELTVQELKTDLAKPQRFTLLPANVSDVLCPAGGTPIFSIAGGGPEHPPLDNPADYVQDYGGFRVVRSGAVLGASASQVVLLGARAFSIPGATSVGVREVAIVSQQGVRHLVTPRYLSVTKALQTISGWGFLSPRGVLLHDTTNLDEVDLSANGQYLMVVEGEKELAVLTRSANSGAERRVILTTQDRAGIKHQEFKEPESASYGRQGLVSLRDGQWLSVNERIVYIETNPPVAPPEQLLSAVLSAVKAGDSNAFSTALESATMYAAEQLRGLSQALAQAPNPFGSGSGMEASARQNLRSARLWKPPEGIPPQQQERARAAVEQYKKSLEQFLADVERIRGGTLEVSPARAAVLIQQGYQYFSGRWIRAPRLVRQESLRSVLLDITFLSHSNSLRWGIFRLNGDAKLQLLGDCGPVSDPSRLDPLDSEQMPGLDPGSTLGRILRDRAAISDRNCQYAGAEGDAVLLLFPLEGLGRVGGGTLEWVDRSAPFKRMERVAGFDSQGRIYLVSAPAIMSRSRTGSHPLESGIFSPLAYPAVMENKGGDLWVYKPKTASPATPVLQLFPVVSLPVMDSRRRVWFLPVKPTSASPWPKGRGALGDLPEADNALAALKPALSSTASVAPGTQFSPTTWDPGTWKTDLCCYDDGKVTSAGTNVPFEMTLISGKAGALLGCASNLKLSKAFLLRDSRLHWATNLHELAQRMPRELLEASPTEARPSSIFVPNYDFSAQMEFPAIARTGEYLWVHQAGCLEVYSNGAALGVQQRLSLMNCPAHLTLQGPVETSFGPTMVIVGKQGPYGQAQATVFWAYASTNGIELVRGPQKDMDANLEIPLVDPNTGTLYLPRFVTPPRFWMVSPPDRVEERIDQGIPAWLDLKRQLIAQCTEQGYNGWRITLNHRQQDVPLSFTRKLLALGEAPDGELVCRTPDGVLWLKQDESGDYRTLRDVPLSTGGFALSYVGESDRKLFLTIVDARQNAYLAVLEK